MTSRRRLEREAKLLASTDLPLPSLEGVIPGVTARVSAARELDATYYDTNDFDLVRFGVTLRYRSGDGPSTWTLKLPECSSGSVIERSELNFAGAPDAVPSGVLDLLTVFLRGRQLEPVVRLRTTRTPIELSGPDGVLVEVVDDLVTPSGGRSASAPFREVEVESKADEPATDRLLRATVRRLVDAGCTEVAALPKVARALGPSALVPPAIEVPTVPRKATLDLLLRHALMKSLCAIVRHDPGARLGDDPEDVHQLRVAVRRLRVDLRSFSSVLDERAVGEVRGELAWLGREIGRTRDSDVLAERLRARTEQLPSEDRRGAALLIDQVLESGKTVRRSMLEALRSARYLHLLEQIHEIALDGTHLGETSDGCSVPGVSSAKKVVLRSWHRLARAAASAETAPSDEALHRVRILAKRCRYSADVVVPAAGEEAADFATKMADLQDVLGEYHDSVVTEAWLRQAVQDVPEARIAAGELIGIERQERAQLLDDWRSNWEKASSKRIRRWLE